MEQEQKQEQEQEQQEEQELPTEEETPQEEKVSEDVQPTKSVKNFWERLDEVFTQNTELRERMEELVEQFPSEQKVNQEYKSFIFQPERIALSSNDDVVPSNDIAWNLKSNQGHKAAETFSSFRIRLKRSIVNPKSIQLLSAVIPNAIQNIPDNQCIFFYYRLRTVANSNLGVWAVGTTYNPGDIVTFGVNTFVCMKTITGLQPIVPYLGVYWLQITLPANTARPNYYDINPYRIQIVFLQPTFGYPPEDTGNYLLYNRTFQDYEDLTNSLVAAANNGITASIVGDLNFYYDTTLNKFQVQGAQVNAATPFYYLPCGYEDPNIPVAMAAASTVASPLYPLLGAYSISDIYTPGYSLNLRLGFTWNGVYPNPFIAGNIYTDPTLLPTLLFFYLRAKDPGVPPTPANWNENLLTANSYGDLVNTSCVRIYTDVSLASAEDSSNQEGLLSVVPVNTSNLGVGFYQNNFSNPLTKIPQILSEIGIRLVNDQGLPYSLPNSATVILEMAITYR